MTFSENKQNLLSFKRRVYCLVVPLSSFRLKLLQLGCLAFEHVVKRLKRNLFQFNAELQLKELKSFISNW